MRNLLLVLFTSASLAGCQKTTVSAASSPEREAAASQHTVAKVVFVDQENACDCTKARITATWTALQEALESSAALPVERLHLDTQSAEAGLFTALKPLMAPPGVYFVDEHNGLVEMLQGELTTAQILAVLKR